MNYRGRVMELDLGWPVADMRSMSAEIAAEADDEIAEFHKLLRDCRQIVAWDYNILAADPRGREDEHRRVGELLRKIDAAIGEAG